MLFLSLAKPACRQIGCQASIGATPSRNSTGQALNKGAGCLPRRICGGIISRKEGESRRSRPLCDLAPLRLCVNKKKCLPVRRGGLDRQQRRGDAKKYNRSLALACLPQAGFSALVSCLTAAGRSPASRFSDFHLIPKRRLF